MVELPNMLMVYFAAKIVILGVLLLRVEIKFRRIKRKYHVEK